MRCAVVLPLVCVVSLGAGAARADEVIPPGHEPLVAAMVGSGAELPARCALDRAAIDRTKIIASYTCDGRPVTLELVSLSSPEASGATSKTAQFALIAKADPPKALIDDITARVTAREKDWRWVSAEANRTSPGSDERGGPPSPDAALASPRIFGAAALGAAALAGLAWLFVSRRRRGATPKAAGDP
jgi:hypothetical protein